MDRSSSRHPNQNDGSQEVDGILWRTALMFLVASIGGIHELCLPYPCKVAYNTQLAVNSLDEERIGCTEAVL